MLCVGFAFAVFVAFEILSRRHVNATVRAEVQAVSKLLGATISQRSDLVGSIAKYAATSAHIKGLVSTDAATVSQEAPNLVKTLGVDGLRLTDDAGRLLGEAGSEQKGGSPAIDRQGIDEARQGRSFAGVVEARGTLMIADSEPVYVGGQLKGTLTAYERLDGNQARSLRGDEALEVGFVYRGRIVAGSGGLDGMVIPSTVRPFIETIKGKQYAGSYATIPGSGAENDMGFVVLRPVAEIMAPFRQFQVTFGFVLGAVGILSLLVGSAFATRLVKSLGVLVGAAKVLKSGGWPDELRVDRVDEIGVLQATFNEMASSLRASRERLLAMVDLDPLTELDNHRRFKERLGTELENCAGTKQSLVLVLLDIDHFAAFNSTHGHAAGDAELKHIADALRKACPDGARIARFGGEEFAVILPGGKTPAAERLFEAVRRSLSGVTISGGCVTSVAGTTKGEGLIVAAELALASAKLAGRERLCDFATVPGADANDPSGVYRYLQDGTYATIRALAAAVDAKDPYTHGHAERVARYAADLAAFTGAGEDEIDLVHRTGTLHDIGKIGVPDSVLQKPGRLTEEEFEAMKAHPVLGELIVSKVPQLQDLLPGIRSHHERYDGNGYPDGLCGDSIPRIARYLSVADTFDAMTSDRPYRAGMPIEAALAEIEKGAGSQFDPLLAAAFVEMKRAMRKAA